MTLSIICPTYNEEKYIADTLQSFLSQQYHSFELEILIVDGCSSDKTREIVQSFSNHYPNIKLVENPQRKTPYAFNAGLKAASGEYVAILGAHTVYESNYLQVCYDALVSSNSIGCTGRVVVQSKTNTLGAKLSEWIMNSKFGVSGSSFRAMKEGYVHSVNFPLFKKQALIDLGGYDVKLLRNQDNDMNQRLLDAGHKLFCTWQTVAYYRPPGSIKKLLRYAYRNGFWNAISIYINAGSMRIHHLIPFFFATGIIAGLLLGLTGYFLMQSAWLIRLSFIVVSIHFLTGLLATIRSIATEFDYRKILMPFVFFTFHFVYGWGTINGFLKGKKEINE